jgi:hypothetical protein
VAPGQKFVDAALGMALDDAGDHIGEVGLRIEAIQLAGLDRGGLRGAVLGAAV